MKPLRIAFLTSEFIIEKPNGGGLGSYLNRIARVLKEMGHEPEIFVRRAGTNVSDVINHDGVRVEHVAVATNRAMRLLGKIDRRLFSSPWGGSMDYLGTALGLARALERRHDEKPFDFVQSTNCGASGLFVRNLPNRPHLIRLSSHRELWWKTDKRFGLGLRVMIWMERRCVCRSDIAYAPSRFLADYCRQSGWREDVHVVRPPMFLEAQPNYALSKDLPSKYLIHFGQIGPRKGSEVLAKALPLAWQQEPDLKMIWAGNPVMQGDYERCHSMWGIASSNVFWLGALRKDMLYALLKGADAAVLPSLVDNLPNTVIESLMLGVPVIGTKGASIDELVEAGKNGELVPMDDEKALADSLVRAWRGQANWLGAGFQHPSSLSELEPKTAVENLINLFEIIHNRH